MSAAMFALAAPSPANAQGIAVNPDLAIPDLPCMTAAERRQLQDLANQESLLWNRRNSIHAQRTQLWNDPAYAAARQLISRVEQQGGFSSSDQRIAYNAAKRLVAEVEAKIADLGRRWDQLERQRRDVRAQFSALLEAIRRRCYTPPTIPLTDDMLPLNPGPIEPMSGPNLGVELIAMSSHQEIVESLAANGTVTNQLRNRKSTLGAGVTGGYNFVPWNNNVRVGPFVSFALLDQTINRTFAGGSFIGSTTNWIAAMGVKAGIVNQGGVFVYGLAALSLLNQDLNINFGGPVTSENKTLPGLTVGVGGEYRPLFLQQWGRPVSLFAQYQHSWWEDAKLQQPAASPAFNYRYKRQDDVFKFGVNVYFGGLTPPPPPAP
jgi:hypothetical protein